MKNLKKIIFVLIVSCLAQEVVFTLDRIDSVSINTFFEPGLSMNQPRIQSIQNAVDAVFNRALETHGWALHNGDGKHLAHEEGCADVYYRLMGIKEEALLTRIAQAHDEKAEVYILDVGCGRGGWGATAQKFLHKNFAHSEKHFHILSITGGLEQDNRSETTGNVTHHRLSQFKIENIYNELLLRGFDLISKVDLIVSHYALRHLVDPFGLLSQLYSLLQPASGMLLTDSFRFALDRESKELISSASKFISADSEILLGSFCWKILSASSAKFLAWKQSGDFDHMLLIRQDDRQLNLPLAYSAFLGDSQAIDYGVCPAVCVYSITDRELVRSQSFMEFDQKQQYCFSNYYYGNDSLSCNVFEPLNCDGLLFKLPKQIL